MCVCVCGGGEGRGEKACYHVRFALDPGKKGSSDNLHFALDDV